MHNYFVHYKFDILAPVFLKSIDWNYFLSANFSPKGISNRAYQKKMAIRSQGKSRQIAANRGKSRQIAAKFGKFRFKKNGDHFFKKSRRIASQRAIQKKMAIILEVKL